MIAIISPAKNMRQASLQGLKTSTPDYIENTKQLVEILKKYNPWELESLLKINPDLALEAFENFQQWDADKKGVAALLAYHGLQYKNINPEDFTIEDFRFADEHIRILSGLYGKIKPTHGILPYRLEMQTKLMIQGENLYGFWGDRLYRDLFKHNLPVINLASKEYSKAIERYLKPHDQFITIEFKVYRKEKLRTIATSAKMARGQMIRYIVKNRLECLSQLKNFNWNGYEFISGLSYENKYVFVQK
ncbi:peroxide stress protein YaaA [Irregularibacter muris]|uniref:UPF0246 protein NSA47_02625 n=1 Tax=Irregularibacter muris TaxID=1796619 RepID=A0AAE3HDB5_9FIRM|nr:peroxide stress protein YaaA [Irregularibacter muris]MCR1897881.1 peroxide stress protein YaaA [Irregularibacter muris]